MMRIDVQIDTTNSKLKFHQKQCTKSVNYKVNRTVVGQRRNFDDAFKQEAVRILAASGRRVEQVAKDLGVARSTLSKWKSQLKEADLLAGPHDDVQKELARLRRENELLRVESDLLKKATAFFASKAQPSSSA